MKFELNYARQLVDNSFILLYFDTDASPDLFAVSQFCHKMRPHMGLHLLMSHITTACCHRHVGRDFSEPHFPEPSTTTNPSQPTPELCRCVCLWPLVAGSPVSPSSSEKQWVGGSGTVHCSWASRQDLPVPAKCLLATHWES